MPCHIVQQEVFQVIITKLVHSSKVPTYAFAAQLTDESNSTMSQLSLTASIENNYYGIKSAGLAVTTPVVAVSSEYQISFLMESSLPDMQDTYVTDIFLDSALDFALSSSPSINSN